MTNKEIFAKVHTILQLAMEISTTTVADVNVEYYGNADAIDVRVYRYGLRRSMDSIEGYDCYLDYPNGYSPCEGIYHPSFDEVIAELEYLKEHVKKLPESEVKPDEHS